MDIKLEQEIDGFIAENRENIIEDIAKLVAVPSVEGKAEPGAPFGPGPKAALDAGLEIAKALGLEVKNGDNKIGWAEVGGREKDKYLATITHVDVVPAGDGWTEDPFTLRRRENYIIGRGVMDDKGPSVLCLYALKFINDKKFPLRYTVRALLGTAEETGMEDVDYFLANYPAPAFTFSPDAEFPVCNGEKGIYQSVIKSKSTLENIVDISGGFVTNAVPDRAVATVKASLAKLKKAPGIELEEADGLVRITARGVAGHASTPEGTVNAIGVLVDYILDNGIAGAHEEKFLTLLQKILSASDGSGINAAAADEMFTPLTIIGGMAGVDNGHMWQTVDSRYPTTMTGEKLSAAILAAAEGCAELEVTSDKAPFYVDAGSLAIRACVDAYNEVTGENKAPFTIGGGTYARDFPFAVSFGPEHDDRDMPDWVGSIHGVDEGANVDWLMEALKIYILAIIKLQDIDL